MAYLSLNNCFFKDYIKNQTDKYNAIFRTCLVSILHVINIQIPYSLKLEQCERKKGEDIETDIIKSNTP